jgi:hypothetical protein
MDIFSSFSEIQKLKMHIFKMFWDTNGYTEKHKDLSGGPGRIWGTWRGTGTSRRGSGTSWGTRSETEP